MVTFFSNYKKKYFSFELATLKLSQARNQDFLWGGANEAKVDQTTEIYFAIVWSVHLGK